MKKVLLLSAVVAMSAAAVNAIEPQVLDDVTINKLSPNGNWGTSDMYGTVTIFDFANDEKYVYTEDYENPEKSISCTIGNGNAISNSGVIVGCLNYGMTPAYWENGEWKMLPVGEIDGQYSADAISADGSVICGYVSNAGETSILPAVWCRNADGTYGDYKILPHPTTDLTGRAPQYITAVCISNDGKTVAGQIQDYRGSMPQPIVYRLNDKNEWEYELIHPELINVNNTEFPEWKEEPTYPKPENFMTPENLAKYEEAYRIYEENGYKDELEPNPADYLSAEELAAYYVAENEYNEWVTLCNEVNEALFGLMDAGAAMFVYNNVFLSGNGKYYGATAQVEIPSEGFYPETKYIPYIFNLETGEYKKI